MIKINMIKKGIAYFVLLTFCPHTLSYAGDFSQRKEINNEKSHPFNDENVITKKKNNNPKNID